MSTIAQDQLFEVIHVGDLVVDERSLTVSYEGHDIPVTRTEFALLFALAQDPTRVHPKAELIARIWQGTQGWGRSRTLDSHACRLRHKLQAAGHPSAIRNVWGVGYALTHPAFVS